MTKLSVALATYNGGEFLEEQLSSLVRQSRLPDELVVSDDGSQDNTLDILQRFKDVAPFPVVILTPTRRLGAWDNFFRAALSCSGHYIALCDQDDVWAPQKLSVGLSRLLDDRSILSMHISVLTDANLVPLGFVKQGISRDCIHPPLTLNPYVDGAGHTMIFDRKLLSVVPPETRPPQPEANRQMSHDTWIYTLAAALGRISHINTPLVLYRQHGTNTVGVVNPSLLDQVRSALTIPIDRHRARIALYLAMEDIFRGLENSPDNDLSAAACRAAEKYRERRKRLEMRLSVYTSDNLTARISAFVQELQYHVAAGDVNIAKTFMFLKDFSRGVCRVGPVV